MNTQNSEGEYLKDPILIVMQYDMDGSSIAQIMSFQRTDSNIWKQIALRKHLTATIIDIRDGTVTYYAVGDKNATCEQWYCPVLF